jgi:hypothetical protein
MSSGGRGETRRRVIGAAVVLVDRVGCTSVTIDAIARALESASRRSHESIHHRLLMTGQPIDAPFASALTDFARLGLVALPEAA